MAYVVENMEMRILEQFQQNWNVTRVANTQYAASPTTTFIE